MENEIKMTPQKEFFINMITRDITLEAAIMELIDNSIDGYKRSNINEPLIEIIIEEDLLEIKDNCGGIPLDIAKNSAFNFGKVEKDFDISKIDSSIGRFGIGMKRSIFKIGNKIEIKTFDGDDNYMILIDVEKWKDSSEWNLTFETIKEKSDVGTCIKINELNMGINKMILDPVFINKLIQLITLDFKEYIINGLVIKLTYLGTEVDVNSHLEVEELVNNDIVKPIISVFEKDGVNVKFVVGAIRRTEDKGKYDPSKAGWYLYCNNRLVICSDQSSLTGWGISPVPKFHVQKARRFRGYCFLESDDSRKLPWNTVFCK